jgi:hypothetical protein
MIIWNAARPDLALFDLNLRESSGGRHQDGQESQQHGR